MIFNTDLLDCISSIELHLKIQLGTIEDADGNIPQSIEKIIGGSWILNFNCDIMDKVHYTEDIIDEFSDIVNNHQVKGNRGASLRWIAQHLHGLIGVNMDHVYKSCDASDLRHLIDSGHFNALFNGSVYEEKPAFDSDYLPYYIDIVFERAIELSDFNTAEYIYKFYREDCQSGILITCMKHGKIEALDWCERFGIDLKLKNCDAEDTKLHIGKLRYLDMAKRIHASNPDLFYCEFEFTDLVYKGAKTYYSRDINTISWLASMMRLDMAIEVQNPSLFNTLSYSSDCFDYVLLDWLISGYHNLLSAMTLKQKHEVMEVLFSNNYVADSCKAGLLAKFVDLCYTGTIDMQLFAGMFATEASMQYLSTRDDVDEFDSEEMEFWICEGNFAMVKRLWDADTFIASDQDRIKIVALSVNYLKVDEITWLFEHTKIRSISDMELLIRMLKEESRLTKDADVKRWVYDQLNLSTSVWYTESTFELLIEKNGVWLLNFMDGIKGVELDLRIMQSLSVEYFHKLVLYFLWGENISILRKIRAADKLRFDDLELQQAMIDRSISGCKSRILAWLILECGCIVSSDDVKDNTVDMQYFVEMLNGATFADIYNHTLESKD